MPLCKLALFGLLIAVASSAQTTTKEIDSVYPDAHALYLDIHQNPELSSHETQTAAKLASKLRNAGYEVTEHVGGTGFVALLKNGDGPTIMLRTELDALPVEEKTGLAYASKIHAKDDAGHDVPVMHACGHDLHMASLIATAEIMARSKNTWHGTLMLIGQPAEETISGAKAMIQDGLFTRFPKPDVGWHCMWAISSRQAWSRWCPESMTRTPTRCASPSTEKEATDRRRRLRSIPS